jgi:ABC-type transporter Mla MlaB component
MVLRIDRTTESEFVVMTLSGHLALEDLADLRRLLEAECAQTLIVDLADVIQVDRDAVSFLASVEAAGVQLRHCPVYVRGWITTEQDL